DGRQDGMLLPGTVPASEPTQELVDKEVRAIVDEAEDEVIELLTRERGRLEALATALLERETLDQPEAYEGAGGTLARAEGGAADPVPVGGTTGPPSSTP